MLGWCRSQPGKPNNSCKPKQLRIDLPSLQKWVSHDLELQFQEVIDARQERITSPYNYSSLQHACRGMLGQRRAAEVLVSPISITSTKTSNVFA